MKISEFTKGDVIQRIAPTERIKDHSYCGSRLEFLGFEKGVIFFRNLEWKEGEIQTLDAFDWDDDNWDYYPEETFQSLKKAA